MQNESCFCSLMDTSTIFLALQFQPIHTNSQLDWRLLCPLGWKKLGWFLWEVREPGINYHRVDLQSTGWLGSFPTFFSSRQVLELLRLIPLHGIVHHWTLLSLAQNILNIKNLQRKVNDHARKHFFTCVLWSPTENLAMNQSSLSVGIALILLPLYFSSTAKSLVLPLKHRNSSGQGTRPSAGVKY